MLRSLLSAADGVVGIDEVFQNAFLQEVPFWTTPSAPLKEASRLLLDVASTPPMSGGVWHAQFIHTFFEAAYRHYLDRLLFKFQRRRLLRGHEASILACHFTVDIRVLSRAACSDYSYEPRQAFFLV